MKVNRNKTRWINYNINYICFVVSVNEAEQAKQEWDGLTRYLDAVMSRFFKVENHQVCFYFD